MNRLGNAPLVCLVTAGELNPTNFESNKQEVVRTIRQAADDGVDLVQIREKALTGRPLLELVEEVVDAVADSGTIVLVNDRIDVALAAGAAGVHLPASAIPVAKLRERFGKDILIGASAHSIEDVDAARLGGANYVFFGPVYPTPGKPNAVGLDGIRAVRSRAGEFPVIGIGGIDETNCRDVIASGAFGVAAIRALNEDASRLELLRELGKFSR